MSSGKGNLPRFVKSDGTIYAGRGRSSGPPNMSSSDEHKILELLKNLFLRVARLEEKSYPDYIDFDVTTGTAGATVTLNHNFNAPIRYYVTTWTRTNTLSAYPTAAPVLVMDASSTANKLVLQSQVAGRAIIRVERAQRGINV